MKSRVPNILVLVETSHGYGRDIIQGISQYLLEHEGRIDFECRGFFEPTPRWLEHWRGDGVICRISNPKTRAILKKLKVPIIDLFSKKSGCDVGTDETALGEMAAEYFLERGFDSFACFVPKRAWWGRERSDGFVQALEKRGCECDVYREGANTKDPLFLKGEKYASRFHYWLSKLRKPCAFLAGTDMYGKRTLNACHALQITVPEEIAVLGVDNDEWFCELQSPQLSSICQNGRKIGYEGAKLLYELLGGGKRPAKKILVPPVFIATRQSTDVIAVTDQDMATAMRYIRAHLEESPTVYRITEAVGLSRRTLERHFLKQYGRSVKAEIMRLRIEKCKDLLRNTNLSMRSIAKKMNFASMEHFIRTFRHHEDISPNEYRKNIIAVHIERNGIGKNEKGKNGNRRF